MKKALSLILAVIMLFGCMSVTAFATTDNSTDITLTVAKPLTYDMVIPEDVTNLNAAGIYSVGQAKVANVKNATDNTVISYTAETTAFKCEGKTDIPASYYTDAQGAAAFPTTAVEVYKSKADAASIPTMYVGISADAWNAAENGTYKATVTFNFAAEEKAAATCKVDMETNAVLYRVAKIDDTNVILAKYNSYDGFDAVWTMGESMTEDSARKILGTEFAVGDCFHQVGNKWEKCIAPETHGLYNELVIVSLSNSGGLNKALFVVPAGATYSIDGNKLYVHYDEKQPYDVDVGQCSWTLNGALLSNGAAGTINDGDAFVGT